MRQSEIEILRYKDGAIYRDLKKNTLTAVYKGKAKECKNLAVCRKQITLMMKAEEVAYRRLKLFEEIES